MKLQFELKFELKLGILLNAERLATCALGKDRVILCNTGGMRSSIQVWAPALLAVQRKQDLRVMCLNELMGKTWLSDLECFKQFGEGANVAIPMSMSTQQEEVYLPSECVLTMTCRNYPWPELDTPPHYSNQEQDQLEKRFAPISLEGQEELLTMAWSLGRKAQKETGGRLYCKRCCARVLVYLGLAQEDESYHYKDAKEIGDKFGRKVRMAAVYQAAKDEGLQERLTKLLLEIRSEDDKGANGKKGLFREETRNKDVAQAITDDGF